MLNWSHFVTSFKSGAETAAEKYGLKAAKVYEDYKELLLDDTIDIVHVLTPNDSHAEISIAALEAGKHVMCEKPMAKTAADAKRMVETAKRTGKKLTIGYNNRFRADSQYLKRYVQNGSLATFILRKRMRFVVVPFQLGAYSWMKRSKVEDRLSISVLMPWI